MEIDQKGFGIAGERDEDGYFGYYPLGTQYLLVEGTDLFVALRFNSDPDVVLLVAHRRRGKETPLSETANEPAVREAVAHLRALEGVREVRALAGESVCVPAPDVG